MATVLHALQNITDDQISAILRELEKMPYPEHLDACRHARTAACTLRRPTWSVHSLAYVNALLQGINKIKYSDSYGTIKLMSTVECYSFAVIGQCGLSFEDYNLAIGPVASVLAPEMFFEEQTWRQEEIPKYEYVRPSYKSIRKPRAKTEDPGIDIVGLVDALVKEATTLMPKPPTTSFHADQTETGSALDAILDSISKS